MRAKRQTQAVNVRDYYSVLVRHGTIGAGVIEKNLPPINDAPSLSRSKFVEAGKGIRVKTVGRNVRKIDGYSGHVKEISHLLEKRF